MNRIASLVGLCSVLVWTASCNSHNKEHKTLEKFPVTTPIKLDTTYIKEYVCQIRSIQHIELRALEKGYIDKIYVDEGQFVRKGQLLFQIRPAIYRAEAEKAQAEVNYASVEFSNTKRLADSNIVSNNELKLAKAKLDKARAELSLAKTHLNFTEVRAPFDGILDRFNVRLGSLIDEGELLTSLSDNSKMWVYFNVPETEYLDYATKAKSDTDVAVNLQMANGEVFEHIGKIETIEGEFNNETGNIAFRATFSNPNKILRHGETGNILMPVQLKNALIIPQEATFDILDKKYVFVIDKDNVVKSRQITIGVEMPHIYTVTSGLETTDKILIDGLRKVQNNDKIKTEFVDPHKVILELNQLHAE